MLGLFLLIAIGAFFPNTSHLSAEAIEHAAVEHAHDDIAVDNLDANHCHDSVSYSGAILTRNKTSATVLTLLIAQTFVDRSVVDKSLLLWRDPPAPIEKA